MRIIDAVLGVTDMAMSRRATRAADPTDDRAIATGAGSHAIGALETRLAGVVVAALKEAFDRDSRRLDLERERAEADRLQAERALRLEWLRQATDREIGRLRVIAGTAVATWLGTLFLASRVIGGSMWARVLLGVGWALLLGALGAAFSGQSRIIRAVERSSPDRDERLDAGLAAAASPWLIIVGLALVAASVIVA